MLFEYYNSKLLKFPHLVSNTMRKIVEREFSELPLRGNFLRVLQGYKVKNDKNYTESCLGIFPE